MRSGWPFFETVSSKAAQPFSPAVVIKRGRLPEYETAAFRVPVDEEESAWRGDPGKFDSQGGGVYSVAHFPPRICALCWAPVRKGVSEEGGRK
jgi:hypothetical protein